MQNGIHAGHRERIINKFLGYPDSFSDHELLEIFLFPVLPRKDTNALAHNLLNAFGSIGKIFSADAASLMSVRGVGEKIAAYIVLTGRICKEFIKREKAERPRDLSTLERTKAELSELFDGLKGERLYFILLDDKFRQVFRLEYIGKGDDYVSADVAEIARAVSVNKAKFAIMAHNHPSGNPEPSEADDVATGRFRYLFEVHGVKLLDHIIFSKNGLFSYYNDRGFENLKKPVYPDKTY